MARILIAGCGWLGAALGTTLDARGDAVWGLRRHPALLPPGIEPIAADLDDPKAVAAGLPAQLDAVVYATAPTAGDQAAYERAYVAGLSNVIDAARRSSGVSGGRVILLSSTSVYGQTAGEWVDETSLTEPADFRGRIVLRGEAILQASGIPSTSLRLGGLYGPGRTSLLDAVRGGRASVSPGPARFTNRIHRDDAVGAILHLLALPAREAAPVYIGVDEEPADRNDVVRWLAARLGASARERTASPGKGPAGRETSDRAETNKRCSSARLSTSGYRFLYPSYREGYEALLTSPELGPVDARRGGDPIPARPVPET